MASEEVFLEGLRHPTRELIRLFLQLKIRATLVDHMVAPASGDNEYRLISWV